jgi:hypothetical protein
MNTETSELENENAHWILENKITTPPLPEYKIISLGYRCTVAGILKKMGLKHESYPFDWIISRLSVIKHCIEDDFNEFLRLENYQDRFTKTFSHINTTSGWSIDEHLKANLFYQPKMNVDPLNSYHYHLAMNHHNIMVPKDFDYYTRCVERFRNEIKSNTSKMFVHISQLFTIDHYQANCENILQECRDFQDFLQKKILQNTKSGECSDPPAERIDDNFPSHDTENWSHPTLRSGEALNLSTLQQNISGNVPPQEYSKDQQISGDVTIRSLYFIMLLDNLETSPNLTIIDENIENPTFKHKIYLLKTNHEFMDAGETFMGNYNQEQELIENSILRFSV